MPIDVPSITDSSIISRVAASRWLSRFNHLLSGNDLQIDGLSAKELYWGDLLCVTLYCHTAQGPEEMASLLEPGSQDHWLKHISLCGSPGYKVPMIAEFGALDVVQAFLYVERSSGRGLGLVRLVPTMYDGGELKAFTLFTKLKEFKGHEEHSHGQRPTRTADNMKNSSSNWKDRLDTQQRLKIGQEPTSSSSVSTERNSRYWRKND